MEDLNAPTESEKKTKRQTWKHPGKHPESTEKPKQCGPLFAVVPSGAVVVPPAPRSELEGMTAEELRADWRSRQSSKRSKG